MPIYDIIEYVLTDCSGKECNRTYQLCNTAITTLCTHLPIISDPNDPPLLTSTLHARSSEYKKESSDMLHTPTTVTLSVGFQRSQTGMSGARLATTSPPVGAMTITSTGLQYTTVVLDSSQTNSTEHGVICHTALTPITLYLGGMVGMLLVLLMVVAIGWVRSYRTAKKHKIILDQIR